MSTEHLLASLSAATDETQARIAWQPFCAGRIGREER